MTNVAIKILAVGDPPPKKEDYPGQVVQGELTDFIILEKGTEGGRTSVMFIIRGPDGRELVAETTARIMNGMYHALKGAMQRFGDSFDG